MSSTPWVHIVDDDAAVRDSLALLCETAQLQAVCYDRAGAFLAAAPAERWGCIVLDMRMPGMTGLQLHEEMRRRGIDLPVIYLTAHGDIPMTVHAMKLGATDFLTKPVDGAVFLERVRTALGLGREAGTYPAPAQSWDQRLSTLTARERQIMKLAVAGRSNKAIARQLGISHRTVEIHRSRVLRKTGAANLLELARIAADHDPAAAPAREVHSHDGP